MNNNLTRRAFIKRSALAAGALSTVNILPSRAFAASSKLNYVQIGCGERGMSHFDAVLNKNKQNFIAGVDPDPKRHDAVRGWMKKKEIDPGNAQFFLDYREMFDKVGSQIDAVFITAPNHHHYTAAAMALQLGKHVYCEKPLCHDISETRAIRELAAKNPKLATQMGNQGHCEEGYHKLCEYVWAGAIGKITETHSWTDRANGGEGPRPPVIPAPAGMKWDSWIGPAPYRDFHSDLHPHEWHGWFDFGNGSIGNMGCHVLDGVYWALKLEHPDSVELEEIRGGSDERYPTGSRVRWDFPARGDMPPVKVYWYEGLNKNAAASPDGVLRSVKGNARNVPALLLELEKKYPDEIFDSNGTLYVGEKGIIYTGTYGEHMRIVPIEKMKEYPEPPKTLPRTKDVFTNFIETVLAGRTDTNTPFKYGGALTEFVLIANLAVHAGLHNKVEWDGPDMKVKNLPDLNAWVKRDHRKGWPV